jgi:dTDP-4-amino-4,6-dideoxygalactose transaminase
MWIPPAHSPLTAADALASIGGGRGAVRALERHLITSLHAERVVLTGSGTQALQLALTLAAAAQPADRRVVALPAYGCYDLATAVLATDLEVRFYDVDPVYLVPEAGSLAHAVAAGAGVVVAANLYGLPLDWSALRELERTTGAIVIEDAAQGIGTRWDDRPGGTLGDLTVLSFGRGKGWTGGGGGALLLRRRFADARASPHAGLRPPDDGAGHARRLGLAGAALAQWALGRPSLYGLPARAPGLALGETRFHEPGPVEAIHPYQAALALRTAAHLEREFTLRRRNAARLAAPLAGVPGARAVPVLGGGIGSWLRMPLRVQGLQAELPARLHQLGVYRGYPRALPDLAQLADRHAAPPGPTSGARSLVQELLTLPTHGRVPLARLMATLPEALTRALRRSRAS